MLRLRQLKIGDIGPPLIGLKDVRERVVGGEKMWTECVKYLLCENQVNQWLIRIRKNEGSSCDQHALGKPGTRPPLY
jgi:hypothetical protein